MDANIKIQAAVELLTATKRDLQLVDEHIAQLQRGRSAIAPADDVSSEHRASWLGVADDLDQAPGILIGLGSLAANFGFNNPKTGTIRNQEDAAFVCTGVHVAVGSVVTTARTRFQQFFEYPTSLPRYVAAFNNEQCAVVPLLRLTDGSSGRNLITGMTEGTQDLDRGAVPFSYFSSIRPGLGSNVKNKLFSEFTIPRAGVVRAEVYNVGTISAYEESVFRVCVSLLGYKVYGG